MKPDQLLTILTSVVLAFLGSLLAYVTTIRRDRVAKRRDLRTQYLLEAYRRLEGAGNRAEPSTDAVKALESAVADIQLLGSVEQAVIARAFALEFAKNGTAPLDPLLESLRSDLRKELSLPAVKEGIVYLRIARGAVDKS
jgi:hypothetical protein